MIGINPPSFLQKLSGTVKNFLSLSFCKNTFYFTFFAKIPFVNVLIFGDSAVTFRTFG